MRGPARFATYLGRILMILGFCLILFAWNGAASLDYLQGQFPYLLSGGMPGLAFIIVGAGLEFIQANRQFTAKRAKQMADLNVAVVKLVGFVRDNGDLQAATPAPDATTPVPPGAGTQATRAFEGAATPAAAAAAVATQERPADADAAIVVAGRSSFHLTTCHLVSGRDDMASITRLEAQSRGLSPCRVCKP